MKTHSKKPADLKKQVISERESGIFSYPRCNFFLIDNTDSLASLMKVQHEQKYYFGSMELIISSKPENINTISSLIGFSGFILNSTAIYVAPDEKQAANFKSQCQNKASQEGYPPGPIIYLTDQKDVSDKILSEKIGDFTYLFPRPYKQVSALSKKILNEKLLPELTAIISEAFGDEKQYDDDSFDDVIDAAKHNLILYCYRASLADQNKILLQDEIKRELEDYVVYKTHKDHKDDIKAFYQTPRGQAIKTILDLNSKSAILYHSKYESVVAFNNLIDAIEKNKQLFSSKTGVVLSIFEKGNKMFNFLNKISENFKQIRIDPFSSQILR